MGATEAYNWVSTGGALGVLFAGFVAFATAILTGKLVPGRVYDRLETKYDRLEEKYDKMETIAEGITAIGATLAAEREERRRAEIEAARQGRRE